MRKWRLIVIACLLFVISSTLCLAESVTIHRDNYGVPHIYSPTLEGLYYGWGYASGEDRLFQLEMLKRIYFGQVAELFGPNYYALDVYWKTEYPTAEELKIAYASLDKKYQRIISAYVEGINAWIKEVQADREHKLPFEFHELGIEPQLWTEVDAAAAIMANLGLFMDLTNEMINVELYTYLTEQYGNKANSYFDDMVWVDDPSAYTTIRPGDRSWPVKQDLSAVTNQLEKINIKALTEYTKIYTDKDNLVKQQLAALGAEVPHKIEIGATESMSYCVVVGPEKSATGNALLMAGPQLSFWVPAVIYEVGLHGAGFDVLGTALIGGPYLLFGASSTTAFSSTAGADNIVDIYEEKLNPLNPRQYFYKGKWCDMEVRTDIIRVKGEEPKTVELMRTVHGPVIAMIDTNKDGQVDIAYTKKTSCTDSYLSAVASFTELMQARTPEQFLNASQLLDPALNLFYADNKGNIGYTHNGKFPIRPAGIDSRFPTPGTGEYEWSGFIPREELPHIINPSSGLIVNWNNKPAMGFDNGDLGGLFTWGGWSVDHRSNNLDRALNDKVPVSIKDLEDIVHEIADAHLEAIAVKDFLVSALRDTSDPQLISARNYLARWDNLRGDVNKDGYYDSVGITIFQEWWPIVNKKTFADELGPFWDRWYNYGGTMDNYAGYSFMVRTVLGEKAAVPLNNDYYNGIGWEKVYTDSLKEALVNLTAKYGTSDMTKWKQEIKTMSFFATHLLGAPTSMGEVEKVKYMDRGSQNHIVDCTWPVITGENVCPPGQSGFINKYGVKSLHFSDQLDLYANWQYKPMLIRKVDVLKNLESTQHLIYHAKKK